VKPGELRLVGMEDEFPAVDAKGQMGKAELIIRELNRKRPEWKIQREGVVISAQHPQLGEVSLEAGDGTLEWSSQPGNLFQLSQWRRQTINHLVEASEARELYLLGIGRHPLTRATKQRLTPNKRYWLFWRRYRERFLSLLEGTAQQIQIHGRSEEDVIALTNDFLQLSALLIALTANSPIYGNKAWSLVSSRVPMWDQYAPGRVGIPERPFANMADWCQQLWKAKLIFGPARHHEHLLCLYGQPFCEVVTAHPMGKQSFCKFAEIHSGCMWWDTRPRFEYATAEIRSACQLPQWMEIALAALVLGLAENIIGRQCLVKTFSWEVWRRARWAASEFHFLAPIGENTLLKDHLPDLVDIATIGLKMRDLGEEIFLEPMQRLIERGHPPAIDQIRAFKEGGVEEVVRQFAYVHSS